MAREGLGNLSEIHARSLAQEQAAVETQLEEFFIVHLAFCQRFIQVEYDTRDIGPRGMFENVERGVAL